MHILRTLGRGLLIVLISITLAVWISLSTMYMTVLQRDVVLGWVEKSGAYDNLVSSIVQLMPTEGDDKQFLGESAIRTAIERTLTPAFIKQSTESVLNASYDWLEGKSQTITFSIPLNEKRPELQKQIALAVEPQIAALPVCASKFNTATEVTCVPQGTSAKAMSEDLARRAVESTDFLKDPLTEKTFQEANIPSFELLRWFMQVALYFVIGLPIFALICIFLYVLLYDQKIVGLRIAARRIFFSTILTVIMGGLLWGMSRQISLGAFGDQAIITRIVDPLFHQIASHVGMWLFIFSVSVLLVSGVGWLVAHIIEKRIQQPPKLPQTPPQPPQQLPPVAKPPAAHGA